MTEREAVSMVFDRDGKFFQVWPVYYNGDGAKHAEIVAERIGGTFLHIPAQDAAQ